MRGATPADGPTLAQRVLEARGIDDVDTFLNPSLHHLHDPSRLGGCAQAARRILEAERSGERIVIYGDYDVDGITASAILCRAIKAVAPEADVTTFIPDRFEHGYGLNSGALTELRERGADLIVTVDCGITAVEQAAHARSIGLDLIITDHHTPPVDLPDTLIVHPGVCDGENAPYPFADLCGAGVAYKLAWSIFTQHAGSEKLPTHLRETMIELLSLAALGTIADIVPLVGENRALARFGLSRMPRSKYAGLCALIEASGIDADRCAISAGDVGFRLGPRLNAAGRLENASSALELLLTDARARAQVIAEDLCVRNERRRSIERHITRHALELAHEQGMTGTDVRCVCLAHPDWHTGVLGICASRVVEKLNRPTILLQLADGEAKGSGRAPAGFSLYDAIDSCSGHLTRFGGHAAAAGLTLASERFEAFRADFIEACNSKMTQGDLTPTLTIDIEVGLSELTLDGVLELDQLEPFGMGNPKPRVLVRNVTLSAPARTIGREGKHVSFIVREVGGIGGVGGVGDRQIRCVKWDGADLLDRLRPGVPITLAACPKVNTFNGRSTVELDVQDIMLCRTGEPIPIVTARPKTAR